MRRQRGGLIGVARVEHRAAVHGPERGDVLERHLRWPVLADPDACVRAGDPDVGVADRCHPDEVKGAGQEGRERRRIGHPPSDLHAHGRRDHLLLGDIELEEALRVRVREELRSRRVADLAVEHHHVAPRRADGGERLAEGRPRGNLVALLVLRQVQAAACEGVRPLVRFRRPDQDTVVAPAAELGDGLLLVRHRLAMGALGVLDGRHPAALPGPRDDRRGLPQRHLGLGVRPVDGCDVVAVDLDGLPSERVQARCIRPGVPAVPGRAALPEPVHVDDGRQVVQAAEGCLLEGLPHRPLRQLAVSAEHPDAVRQPVEQLAGEPQANPDRQALAERSGRDVDPRQAGRRMAFQAAAERPVRQELRVVDRACSFQHRVQQRRGVALGEDQVIVAGVAGRAEVEAQVPGQQHSHQVGRGQRGRRMAGVRRGTGTDSVDPQLLREAG